MAKKPTYKAETDLVMTYTRKITPFPLYISVYETGIAPETHDHLGLLDRNVWEDMIYSQFADGTKDISPKTPPR